MARSDWDWLRMPPARGRPRRDPRHPQCGRRSASPMFGSICSASKAPSWIGLPTTHASHRSIRWPGTSTLNVALAATWPTASGTCWTYAQHETAARPRTRSSVQILLSDSPSFGTFHDSPAARKLWLAGGSDRRLAGGIRSDALPGRPICPAASAPRDDGLN